MRKYKGTVSSGGLAEGRLVLLNHDGTQQHRLTRSKGRECAMLGAALEQARQELGRLRERAREEEKEIFTFQQMLLQDDDLLNKVNELIARGTASAAAMEQAAAQIAAEFAAQPSEYMQARKADVLDACRRVVDILDGRSREKLVLTEPAILLSEDFYPSDIVGIGRGMILGLAASGGSPHSHAAIIARSFGIPMLVGLGASVLRSTDGAHAVLDAQNGFLALNPGKKFLIEAHQRMEALNARRQSSRTAQPRICRTRDGTVIELCASAMDTATVADAVQSGVGSIGLLRSEFLLDAHRLPGERAQVELYRRCVAEARGRRITVRTFDLGADKNDELCPPAPNPALGLRGIRIGNVRPKLLRDQLCALLRVSVGGNVRIAFPMVTCAEDWNWCMDQLEQAREILRSRGTPFDEELPVGLVIDTPAAAICAEELILHHPDFVLISVSDLTQYTYAADRMNQAVLNYYKPQGRAVSSLIRTALESARKYAIPASLCGVGLMSPDLCEWFVRLGAHSLVLPAGVIPEVQEALAGVDLRQNMPLEFQK